MTHGKIGMNLLLLAAAALMLPLVGCGGDSPKRRGPQNYREYKMANVPGYAEKFGGGADAGPTDNGEFGPTAPVTVTSADDIVAGKVPGSGSLKGTIKYGGKAAKERVVNVAKDPKCTEVVKTEDLMVSATGGLKNVVVYVSRGFIGTDFEVPSKPFLVDQTGCRYVPHVVAAMAGQELSVKNSDPTSHNYHFTGLANDEINKTQPNQNQVDAVFLNEAEMGASFACDIHPWMRAPVYTLTHPYFAVTAEDGSFEIKGLPPGKYEISFAHERNDMKSASMAVTIESGKAASITAEFRR